MSEIKDEEPIDAFLCYREGEQRVARINRELKDSGVRTHYFSETIKIGEPIDESDALLRARCLVVFLGDRGWGPTQAKLLNSFKRTGSKRILLVLIGNPSEHDLDGQGGMFRSHLYVDLRKHTTAGMTKLIAAIREANVEREWESDDSVDQPNENESDPDFFSVNPQLKRLIRIFSTGPDSSRLEALSHTRALDPIDKARLATALRTELASDSLTNEEQSAHSRSQLSATRSWMLSALLEVDAEGSEEFVLHFVDQDKEEDRNVRFWTLAGLVNRRLSFRAEAAALAMKDRSPEIALLGKLLGAPAGPEIANEMRRAIRSSNPEIVWPVLRALRAYPVPQLALDLADVLTSPGGELLRYEVLFAMTPPPMADAVAPHLEAQLELPDFTRAVVETVAGSNYQRGEQFIYLLGRFDRSLTLEILARLKREQPLRFTATQLIQQLHQQHEEGTDRTRPRPGFHTDKPGDTVDRLGIAAEARTLAAIMMARDVHPPLAIGLFGNWGSGKSFFMGEIQRQARQFSAHSAENENSSFCEKVAHIEFNAWHYADSNLWASLVSCILEKLNHHVGALKTTTQKREDLERQLVHAVQEEQKAVVRAEQAAEELRRKNELLAAAELERHQRPILFSELLAGDWKRLIENDKEAKNAVEKIANDLGINDIVDGVRDWDSTIGEIRAQSQLSVSLAKSVAAESRAPIWLALVIAVLVLPFVVWLLQQVVQSNYTWVVAVTALMAQIAVVLTGTLNWLRGVLSEFTKRRKQLEKARNWVNQLLQAKRDVIPPVEVELQNKVQEALKEREAADAIVVERKAQVLKLEADRDALSLARFINDRHKSDDYRKELGIYTTIRRDFEELVEHLTPKMAIAQPLERIVLYIDDLDRCPAEKVVEVLQAVHLLLAYPLFVVVVGVDSRWLLHSLSSQFKQFDESARQLEDRGDDRVDEHRLSTPQHYLEKIFQIPYALRSMTDLGFGQMIDVLLASAPPADDEQLPTMHEGEPSPSRTHRIETGSPVSHEVAENVELAIVQRPEAQVSGEIVPGDERVRDVSSMPPLPALDEASLMIQPWETEYAKRLREFIPSPRAAKRFSNTYRIVKAGLRASELQNFEGSSDFPGEFRLVMMLLALQIYAPQDVRLLRFQFPASSEPTQESEKSGSATARAWKVLSDDGFREVPRDRVYHWAPIVSRFSFDMAR